MSGPAEGCAYCTYLGQTPAQKRGWITYPTEHSGSCEELERQRHLQAKEPQVKITKISNTYEEPMEPFAAEPVYEKDTGWRRTSEQALREQREREKKMERERALMAERSPHPDELGRLYSQITLNVPVQMTKQAKFIIEELMQEWVVEFVDKNNDYQDKDGNLSDELGSAGQWGDLYRKVRKLKKPMWDERGAKLNFEQTDEILRDLIGHSFLALYFLRQESVRGEM